LHAESKLDLIFMPNIDVIGHLDVSPLFEVRQVDSDHFHRVGNKPEVLGYSATVPGVVDVFLTV